MERLRTLGIVFLALGIIEACWAFFCVAGGGLLGIVGFADERMQLPLWIGSGLYVLLAGVAVVLAAVHVIAGVRLRRGKGLVTTLLALGACFVSMIFALYCAPFSFGAAVYCAVVLLDPASRKLLESE